MDHMMKSVVGMDNNIIRKMFREYVESVGDESRHTREARYETELFNAFLAGAFPNNPQLRDALYLRMMDCAVEFEESGFIAGVRFALGLSVDVSRNPGLDNPYYTRSGASPALQNPIPATPATSRQAPVQCINYSPGPAQIVTPAQAPAQRTNQAADSVNHEPIMRGISSEKIAELFETSNAKVVKRIEEFIMPKLDTQSKRYFRMEIEYTPQHRRYRVYYLNKTACDLYMAEMEPHKKFVNIAGGIVKLRELMKRVFPSNIAAS